MLLHCQTVTPTGAGDGQEDAYMMKAPSRHAHGHDGRPPDHGADQRDDHGGDAAGSKADDIGGNLFRQNCRNENRWQSCQLQTHDADTSGKSSGSYSPS